MASLTLLVGLVLWMTLITRPCILPNGNDLVLQGTFDE